LFRGSLSVALTIEDLCREVHDTHHPIAVSLYYEDQKPEAKRRAEDFRTHRMPVFLRYSENLIRANPRAEKWLVDDKLTYCDLCLFQTIEGLRYAFPNAMAGLAPQFRVLVALCERVRTHQRVAPYLQSGRRPQFNEEGIFRHYPVLD